jgi:UDP:flavonoid glycosyltransferase YjiC (YdhE family)
VVYLHADYPHIDAAMDALAACSTRVIAYILGADQKRLQRYAALGVAVAAEPVDIARLLKEADLCVTHGPGTALAALEASVPVLMLPKQLENFLFALALQRIGVGHLVNPEQANPDIKAAFAEMLANPGYSISARAFADLHRGAAIGTIAGLVVARIEALAAGPQEGRK